MDDHATLYFNRRATDNNFPLGVITRHPDGLCRRCDRLTTRRTSAEEAYAKAPLIGKVISNVFLGAALLCAAVCVLIVIWSLEGAIYRLRNHPTVSSTLIISGVACICSFGLWNVFTDRITGRAQSEPTWYEQNSEEEYEEF